MVDIVFNDDVIQMKKLIGRSVSIKTIDDRTHNGTIYVIDPVYKTVVLINTGTDHLEIILKHAIKSFNVVSDARNEDFLRQTVNNSRSEDVIERKEKLEKWLRHMFLDVREDGDMLRVEDHLLIGPPYGRTECLCDNTIVLERIRNIIDQMPPDFK